MKLPDTEQLLPEEYVAIGDPWRQEWERGVQVPVHEDRMHVPITRYYKAGEMGYLHKIELRTFINVWHNLLYVVNMQVLR